MLAARIPLAISCAIGLALAVSPAQGGDGKKDGAITHDPLIAKIAETAPSIVKHLLAKNDTVTVGVLKFLVQRTGEPMSDNVGDLNRNMADWLEVALVQAAPPDRKMGQTERLRIIRKASEKIALQNDPKYSHRRNDADRKAFFDLTYNLWWGKEKVEADVFITGEVVFGKEGKARIQFKIFGRDGKIDNLLSEIVMTPTLKMLTNAGYSVALAEDMLKEKNVGNLVAGAQFLHPVVNDAKKPEFVIAATDTPALRLNADPFHSPIRVSVIYKKKNGRTIDQPITNGMIQEPEADDDVSIVIENPTEHTFAVLVRVNGLNTIFPEKPGLDPRLAHKWILKPGEKQVIDGFQTDDTSFTGFKVLTPKESKADEVNYGNDVGTIQIVSFIGEVVDTDPEKILTVAAEKDIEKINITRGTLTFGDGAMPMTLEELQGHLKDTGKMFDGKERGLIVKGNVMGKKEVKRFYFRNEAEAQNATIRYYSSKAR